VKPGLIILFFISLAFHSCSIHYLNHANYKKIEWEPVSDANGYMVQIKNDKNQIIKNRAVNKTKIRIFLKPGNYQIRISSLNSLKKPSLWSTWTPLDQIIRKKDKTQKMNAGLKNPDGLPAWKENKISDKLKNNFSRKDSYSAVLQSAVIPGLGQYKKNHKIKGGVFFGAATILGMNAYNKRIEFLEEQSTYNEHAAFYSALTALSSGVKIIPVVNYFLLRNEFNSLKRTGGDSALSINLFLITFLANIFDAYFFNDSENNIKGTGYKKIKYFISGNAFANSEVFNFPSREKKMNAGVVFFY